MKRTAHREHWIVGVYQAGPRGHYARFVEAGEDMAGLDVVQRFNTEQEALEFMARSQGGGNPSFFVPENKNPIPRPNPLIYARFGRISIV